MGVYVGMIQKVSLESGSFFNFKPIAEFRNSQIIELTRQDLDELLPDSERRNINLEYAWNDFEQANQMDNLFPAGSLAQLEFETESLEPNIQHGERNLTGYKVSAISMVEEGKLSPIGKDGLYYPVFQKDIRSDFYHDVIVEISAPNVADGTQVLVELDNCWAGPYQVGYRDHDGAYYIRPQIKENKHTVAGYRRENVRRTELSQYVGDRFDPSTVSWELLIVKQGAPIEQVDLISDEELIEAFKACVENSTADNGNINLDDIPSLINQYNDSELSGAQLSTEISKARMNRLVSIMTSEEDINETMRTITDFVCDLLVKYRDSSNVDEWLQALIQKHPQLLDELQSTQTITQHIADLKNNLQELASQKADIEDEIEQSKQRAETINQQAIEAKKKEMLEKEREYAELSERIDAAKEFLGKVEEVGTLQKKYDKLSNEVKYLDMHKGHLANETSGLELQFKELVNKAHDEMVSISFDGFMASKMLRAAAEWEDEQENAQYKDMTARIETLETQEMSQEDVIDYLVNVIHTVRPHYTRNTIINIAICMTQGFLTVFSGEPGCGKTSICNIFADVLGLNKVPKMIGAVDVNKSSTSRFVSVSVERGWTSKRDFIGYYNPLSKSFDKSNRRIYDALYQLDIEKKSGNNRLPYIILLDEANLSPMEYYWSDFMNVCDDLGPQSAVNLGENYIFGIPETLHFLATINNDHTTEILSPRLIDRAWIITLPQLTQQQLTAGAAQVEVPDDKINLISWQSLKNAFIPQVDSCKFSPDIQRCYDTIVSKLKERRIIVSPRIDRAIKRYWVVASKCFEIDEMQTSAPMIALDYAIVQRILPKIAGNGEEFREWLEEFRAICSNNGLNSSDKLLRDMIERGDQQMKYYQFFC